MDIDSAVLDGTPVVETLSDVSPDGQPHRRRNDTGAMSEWASEQFTTDARRLRQSNIPVDM
ncbi:hypothetical protein NDI85_04020 [Halomicroarcula sp. S1AR25-4]|uniref:hypothetical protein n=1 Tax=Haloarcula sp. S1AR25-4 TaxID=2950538 RepID=UPI0028766688|nr:hypothetical protein [Halomicroarcula sp. S1AR25-4]MDS0276945.1 hypothetical protein [Halomicroarcula sp. S1AR25-4]